MAMMMRMISMWKPLYSICFDKRTLNVSKSLVQVAFLCCALLFLGAQTAWATDWSDTKPKINLSHIFEGGINGRGKPVGFHARPMGKDPEMAKLDQRISGPNQVGVYTGRVEILDRATQHWKVKSLSSFFPDRLGRNEILSVILKAYAQGKVDNRGKWRGASGLGFTIEGWLCPKGGRPTCPEGAINTAYPIYKKDE
jgi:hypothetical protein